MSRLFYFTFIAFSNSLDVIPRRNNVSSKNLYKLLEDWQGKKDLSSMAVDLQKIGSDFIKTCNKYQTIQNHDA